MKANKKTNLKAVSQNSKKKSADKAKTKPAKPVKPGAKKPMAKKTNVKPAAPAKNSAPKKTTPKNLPKNVAKAEELRTKNLKDMVRLERIQQEWAKKWRMAKTDADRKAIDVRYDVKFKTQEEKESKSYAAYYNHVRKNFTKEQQKAAFNSSGDFMSKKYTNGLLKAVRDEQKR